MLHARGMPTRASVTHEWTGMFWPSRFGDDFLAPAIWYRAILAMNYFDTDVFGRRVVLAPVKSLTNVCNENG